MYTHVTNDSLSANTSILHLYLSRNHIIDPYLERPTIYRHPCQWQLQKGESLWESGILGFR